MSYTLWEFLQSDIAAGTHQFAGPRDLKKITIEAVSVQELPVDDFIQKNELVLSTAVGCLNDEAAFLHLIQSVKSAGATALFLTFRNDNYVIPRDVIGLADSICLPLFSIPWKTRFSNIQSEINKAIRDKKLSIYQELQSRLFNAYFEGKSINYAVAIISKALQLPIVITETHRNILVQSEIVSENSDDIAVYEPEIYVGNIFTGYLKLYTDKKKPIPQKFLGINDELVKKYICFPLSLWFNQKNIEDLTALRLKNDFVWDLAYKTDISGTELLRQGARLHFNLNCPYTCALLRVVQKEDTKDADGNSAVAYASTHIEDLLIQESKKNNAVTMVACRNLDYIMYIGNTSANPDKYIKHFLDSLQMKLTEAFSSYKFYWGISEITDKAPDFPQLFQNASLALQYCMHSSSTQYCFTYHDTKEAQIVSVLSGSEKIRQIAHELLLPLKGYGSDSGLDLLKTLSTFIRCNYNSSQTARELHIHRQSLLYRLEKITALTGLSLDDHRDLFLLEISLRVFSIYL